MFLLLTERGFTRDGSIARTVPESYGGYVMAAPVKPQQERTNWTADTGRRRSMRVLLSVPIQASGKTTDGKDFQEQARTLIVNAHGALISLSAAVAAGQKITIANKATRQSVECSVVYLGTAQAGKTQMGIEFVRPSPDFWQIDFPPDDWVVPED